MTPASGLRWLWLSVALVALDQLTKHLALAWLTPHLPLSLIPGLNFTLTFNTGAAFSFLSDAAGWQRWALSALAAAISVALVVWLARLRAGDWRLALPLALILAGAVGNLIDRVRWGYVVDFIDVYAVIGDQAWHWPAFNVADSAITVGAVALAVDALLGGGRER